MIALSRLYTTNHSLKCSICDSFYQIYYTLKRKWFAVIFMCELYCVI